MSEENRGETELIRVLLVEDDADWRRGIADLVSREPDMTVAAEAGNADDGIAAAERHDIDVTLMDVMMASGPEGLRATEEISRRTASRVVMLTSMEDRNIIIGAFKAGAVDYVVKENFQAIPEAIRSAYRTGAPLRAEAAESLREEIRRLKSLERELAVKEVRDKLTPAELHILQLIAEGRTQTEIADRLFVSIRTVKIHVGNLLRKLGETNSKEAARKVRDLGIIE